MMEETDVVLEYSVSKRFPTSKLEEAKKEYEILNGSGVVLTLDQLLSIKRTGKWEFSPTNKSKEVE